MARGKGRSGRRYVRDAKGRFASKGYVGQTGGRGARLKSGKGNIRQVGGQKRGERHILRSPESKAAGKRSFDASVAYAKLTLPKKLGGQGMPRDSFLARAAKAKKTEANAAAKAARRKTGLPESSVRLSRRVKRDPNVGEKLQALRQRNQGAKQMSKEEFARRTGGKTRADSMGAAIEMSRQPRGRTKAGDRRNEARLRKIQDEVRATDKAYDAAIKSGRIKAPTRRLADIASGHSDNASVQAARRLQSKVAAARAARQRGDTASVNVPMSGSRGRRLNAEISRNVKQQQTTKRAESRARNAQIKSDQSRAKALRGKYGDQLAKDFAAKSGRKVSEVKAAIKGMAPAQQVKLLTQAGREQRAQANLARTADTRNKPGSAMVRRPSQKMTRGNLRAEKALEFYKDPKKALKSVNKKRPGFKLPRSMRGKRK